MRDVMQRFRGPGRIIADQEKGYPIFKAGEFSLIAGHRLSFVSFAYNRGVTHVEGRGRRINTRSFPGVALPCVLVPARAVVDHAYPHVPKPNDASFPRLPHPAAAFAFRFKCRAARFRCGFRARTLQRGQICPGTGGTRPRSRQGLERRGRLLLDGQIRFRNAPPR